MKLKRIGYAHRTALEYITITDMMATPSLCPAINMCVLRLSSSAECYHFYALLNWGVHYTIPASALSITNNNISDNGHSHSQHRVTLCWSCYIAQQARLNLPADITSKDKEGIRLPLESIRTAVENGNEELRKSQLNLMLNYLLSH